MFSHPQNFLLIKMVQNVLDLNDDCLFHAFKEFTVFELADIASTCSRFQQIAREIFSKRHTLKCLEITVEACDLTNDRYLASRRQTAAILRKFGDLLTKVKVNFASPSKNQNLYNSFIFNMMAMYCTGTLERLEMRRCKAIQSYQFIDATDLFRNGKELNLNYSSAIHGSFLSDAGQLLRLSLNGFSSTDVDMFFANNYPRLQSITLNNCSVSAAKFDIVHFLKRHPNLIVVELRGCGVYDLLNLGECATLSKLSILDCDRCPIWPISELNNLNTLKMASCAEDESLRQILQTSKSFDSLEHLVLADSLVLEWSI